MRKLFVILYSVVAISIVIGITIGCATSPTGRRQLQLLPESEMTFMGTTAFDEMKQKQPISRDARTNGYVKCIANEITGALSEKQNWEVVVFDVAEPNAFALPGGKIGVYTGMLKVATDPGMLAAVFGHEVGHVLAHHSNERVSVSMAENLALQGAAAISKAFVDPESRTYAVAMAALGVGAQLGVILPYSRAQESEADEIGLTLMSNAGFEPKQAVELWRKMEAVGGNAPPEFMSTHPSNSTRIAKLQSLLPGADAIYRQVKHRPNCKL